MAIRNYKEWSDCETTYDEVCDICGDEIAPNQQLHKHDGDDYCRSCFNDIMPECDMCNERHEPKDTIGNCHIAEIITKSDGLMFTMIMDERDMCMACADTYLKEHNAIPFCNIQKHSPHLKTIPYPWQKRA